MANKINFTTVEGIKNYAKSKYEQGGHWIFECWTDEDIVQFIKHRDNGREVRRDIIRTIRRYNEEEREVLAEVF